MISKNKLRKFWTILLLGLLSLTCEEQVFDNPYDSAYKIEAVKEFVGEQVGEHIKLTWKKNGDVKTGYMIERKAPDDSDFSVLIDSLSPNITTYVDSFITTDKTYFYKILGSSGENSSMYSETMQVETLFPQPANLIALQISDIHIQLSWEDNSNFEEGFQLERKASEQDFELLSQLEENVTSFIDEQISINTSYAYRIKAFTSNNESKYAYSDTQTVLFPKPTNLRATLVSATEIRLDWNDNNPFELGFRIERATEEESFGEIAELPKNITSYLDSQLEPGRYYYYRVMSFGESIESDYSNVDSSWVGYTFMKYFDSGGFDFGYYVDQTNDGGYVITGYSGNAVWLIKTNSSSEEEWNRKFAGGKGYSVQQTMDNGYIVTGSNGNVLLIKFDSQGGEEWYHTFGSDDYYEYGYSGQQVLDGGFIITGVTNVVETQSGSGDLWLIKTDAAGNEEWNNIFDKDSPGKGYSVKPAIDGGFVIAGVTGIYPKDIWLIKTDVNGIEEWSRTFDRNGNDDIGSSLEQTEDAGYIICGTTNNQIWLIKTNANGVEEWDRTFSSGSGLSVQQTFDAGYIIAGSTNNNYASNGQDVWLIKTDNIGIEEWSRTFHGGNDDWGYSVQQTKDGGFVIVGNSWRFGDGDILLIKTDPEGNVYE